MTMQQLTNATAAMTALTEAFNTKMISINVALNTATQNAGNTMREFWVDEINGNDTASGTQSAPLKSLREVSLRTVRGGLTLVNLIGDYEMHDRVNLRGAQWTIIGSGANFTTKPGQASNSSSWPPQFLNDRNNAGIAALTFVGLNIHLNDAGAEAPLILNNAFLALNMNNVNFTVAENTPRRLTSGTGVIGLVTVNLSFPPEMAGLWNNHAAAGSDPAENRRIAYSSLATL